MLYDTLRATDPADFVDSATCLESDDGSDTTALDTTTPDPGALQAYLVRAEHSCGASPLGIASSGAERTARSCPQRKWATREDGNRSQATESVAFSRMRRFECH